MNKIKILVSKNHYKDKAIKEGKANAEKYPDIKIKQIVENGMSSEFVEVGVAWKSKSGNGYNGTIDVDLLVLPTVEKTFEEEAKKFEQENAVPNLGYQPSPEVKKEIDSFDATQIPF